MHRWKRLTRLLKQVYGFSETEAIAALAAIEGATRCAAEAVMHAGGADVAVERAIKLRHMVKGETQ